MVNLSLTKLTPLNKLPLKTIIKLNFFFSSIWSHKSLSNVSSFGINGWLKEEKHSCQVPSCSLTVYRGREAVRTPGGTGLQCFSARTLVFSPQRLHSFFSFIALFSLWHWLSNSSSNRTGWLLPTLARKDPFHVVDTCTHANTHVFKSIFVFMVTKTCKR